MVGIFFSSSTPFHDLATTCQTMEYHPMVDSFWLSDHIVKLFAPEGRYFHSWALLPALAAVTQRAKLGVLVSDNGIRHPSVLARMAVTVDEISNGRLILGIGAGWYKPEFKMMGVPMSQTPIRALESGLSILDFLIHKGGGPLLETADYPPLREVIFKPKVENMPFLVGGHGPRVIQIAAEYGDIYNSFGLPDEMRERIQYLDSLNPRVGKSVYIGSFLPMVSLWESPEAFQDILGAYAEAGCNQFIIDAPRTIAQMEVFGKCSLPTSLQTSTKQ